jgi:hypothetical protein
MQYPYTQPMPRFQGYGQPPAAPAVIPGGVTDMPPEFAMPALGPIGQMTAAVVQELRNLFGISLDRNEETAWLTFDTTPVRVIATGTNVRAIMTVGQEADFVATGIVAQVVDTAAPPVLVATNITRFQIRDGSTNRELQRASMPMSFLALTTAGASAGARPFFLSKPRIFSRNSNVIWLFDNAAGGAADVDIDVAFFGYRIYDIDALNLTQTR